MKENKFTKAYLTILEENAKPAIDELVKENSATIDEGADQNNVESTETSETSEPSNDNLSNLNEDGEDATSSNSEDVDNNTSEDEGESDDFESGWNDNVKETLQDVLTKMDDISYEIRNCTRGSLTGCTNVDELKEYLKEFAEELIEVADSSLN